MGMGSSLTIGGKDVGSIVSCVAIFKHNLPVNGLSGSIAWKERSAFRIHEGQPRSVFGNRHLLETP